LDSFESTSAPELTTMSQPSTKSAAPAPIRVAKSAAGSFAIRTWLVTGPFFWARPVTSSTEQPLPSRCAAIPSSAPSVTTPEPPIPATSTLTGRVASAGSGTGSAASSPGSSVATPGARPCLRSRAPRSVTKDGQ
jgi:hypothetical protein